MARRLPPGMILKFKRWSENGGEKFHNRYLLTDHGGVTFGIGLDENEGNADQTEDINLMDRNQYLLRWAQYTNGSGQLSLVDEPVSIPSGQGSNDASHRE